MDSMWLVLQCQSCGQSFGRQSSSKSIACPHCNHADAKVISRHFTATEASDAVSLANVPTEIRDQLSNWISQQPPTFDSSQNTPVDGNSILAKAENEDGIITLQSLRNALVSLGMDIDVEEFAEHASAEGELIRFGTNCWKRT